MARSRAASPMSAMSSAPCSSSWSSRGRSAKCSISGIREEVTIRALAERIKAHTGSASEIQIIPYDEAYEAGFEDMPRRVPDLSKIAAPYRLRGQSRAGRDHRTGRRRLPDARGRQYPVAYNWKVLNMTTILPLRGTTGGSGGACIRTADAEARDSGRPRQPRRRRRFRRARFSPNGPESAERKSSGETRSPARCSHSGS